MEVNLPFLVCFTLSLRAIFQVQAPGGLYLEGRCNGGFFALPVWGTYIWRGSSAWRGLFSEFYGIFFRWCAVAARGGVGRLGNFLRVSLFFSRSYLQDFFFNPLQNIIFLNLHNPLMALQYHSQILVRVIFDNVVPLGNVET